MPPGSAPSTTLVLLEKATPLTVPRASEAACALTGLKFDARPAGQVVGDRERVGRAGLVAGQRRACSCRCCRRPRP